MSKSLSELKMELQNAMETSKRMNDTLQIAFKNRAQAQNTINEVQMQISANNIVVDSLKKDIEQYSYREAIESNFKTGAVFVGGKINPLLVVKVTYGTGPDDENAQYQLLGMGCGVNSNHFYITTHTKKECVAYLVENNMKFYRNIDLMVYDAVYKGTTF